MKKRAIIAALLSLTLAGCGSNSQPQAVQMQPVSSEIEPLTATGTEYDEQFGTAQLGFALNLLQQTAAENQGANLLISPYSVMQALAMTANGANGETLSQMEQVLGGLPVAELDQYLYAQRSHLPDTENAKYKIANSVWFRDDSDRLQIKPNFLQTAERFFGAAAYRAPFDDTTVQEINDWCSEHTDQMIPQLIETIEPEEVMYLINAVCFDAKWANAYEEEPSPLKFKASSGAEQDVQMMFSDERYYLQDAHAVGFLKDYMGGGYAFAALLPDEGMSAEAYLAQLTPETLKKTLISAETCPVRAGLPKFSYDFETEMSKTLKTMGMPLAFEEGADFSNMGETASSMLMISKVLHKTHIDVDTEGTKAAAVTAVAMEDEAVAEMPDDLKIVCLNRPFVYFIVETEHMTPIFSGILNQPNE